MRKSIFLIEIVLCHMPDWQPGLGRIWGGGARQGGPDSAPAWGWAGSHTTRVMWERQLLQPAARSRHSYISCQEGTQQSLKTSQFLSVAGRSLCTALGLLQVRCFY